MHRFCKHDILPSTRRQMSLSGACAPETPCKDHRAGRKYTQSVNGRKCNERKNPMLLSKVMKLDAEDALRQEQNRWNCETVNSILKSRIYLGDMVQGIYDCSHFKRAPSKRKSPEEWYITPNTHEPSVDLETREHVQTCVGSRKRVIKSNEVQLFAGFLKCEDCGRFHMPIAKAFLNTHAGITGGLAGRHAPATTSKRIRWSR